MEDQQLRNALIEVAHRLRAQGRSPRELKEVLDLPTIFKDLHLMPPSTMGSKPAPPSTQHAGRPVPSGQKTPPPSGSHGRSPSHPATMIEGPDSALLNASKEALDAASQELTALKDGRRLENLQLGTELGRGGMGLVVEAFDHDLLRRVAVKLLLKPSGPSSKSFQRFMLEAVITAQLDHPNIVPIHDMKLLPTGSPYFVMKRVQGRSLRDIFLALLVGDRATQRDWTPRRLLQAFIQVCNALSYAHEFNVIHRDIKPDNIMLGDFGEVYLMDWGVARLLGSSEARPKTIDYHEEFKPGTLDGATVGTPGYMSPEQATGDLDALKAHSDVWSLGAILYEILTWRRAFENLNTTALIIEAASRSPIDPRERTPGRQIPEEIAKVCMKALSILPEDRYQSAQEFAEAVEAFLEGSARKKAAERRLIEGEKQWERYKALELLTIELEANEEVLQDFFPPHAPLEEKRELLDVRHRRDVIERERIESFEAVVAACEGALSHDPENGPARALLAEVYWQRLLDAEAQNDLLTAKQHAGRVRAYGTPRDHTLLRGTGALTLLTATTGATVACQSIKSEGLIWPLGEARALGTTPIERVELEMGSYLLTITRPDGASLRYPINITRDRHWHSGDEPLTLYTPEEIGEGFAYIPPGPALCGGDPSALNSLPRDEPWVPGFFLAIHPVTLGEYCEFINSIAESDFEAAWGHVPRLGTSGGQLWDRPIQGGEFHVPRVDRDGELWDSRWPVSGVSWHDALSFARWCSRRDGVQYTLLREREWEKAARGVDGRIFPWGDHFDATLCKMRDSRSGRSTPEPTGSFKTDRSLYGVYELAGGIREWCRDPAFNNDPDRRVVRGGSWNDEVHACRSATRLGVAPWHVAPEIGFRLVRYAPLPVVKETD